MTGLRHGCEGWRTGCHLAAEGGPNSCGLGLSHKAIAAESSCMTQLAGTQASLSHQKSACMAELPLGMLAGWLILWLGHNQCQAVRSPLAQCWDVDAMLAGLLTTVEATTKLRCLAKLHCCQTALLPLRSCPMIRQLQTVPGSKLCSEVRLTWHPEQKPHQHPFCRTCPGQC